MRSTAEVLFSLWIHAGFMAVSVVFKTQGPDQRCFHYKINCFGVVFTGDVWAAVFSRTLLFSCWIHAGFMLDSCEMLLERMGLEFVVGSSEFVVDL